MSEFGSLPIIRPSGFDPRSDGPLRLNTPLVADWLVRFLQDEMTVRRGFKKAVVGVSGGVDSAVTAYLCARAFGAENVYGFRMPYKVSSQESLDHAQLVADDLGIHLRTIEITQAVDGYLETFEPEVSPARIGNVCARMRMIILFDQSAKVGALPVGTGNKTERLFGYFTWHADDSPPINPLGDLYKTQVWQLARELGVPKVIVEKPASADLIKGQTDEGDFGISYPRADRILHYMVRGFTEQRLVAMGFDEAEVRLVKSKVDATHWKRHLPTVAMLSTSAINEYYLRPVDFSAFDRIRLIVRGKRDGMDLSEFKTTLTGDAPPEVALPLQALWWDAKGNSSRAHDLLQDDLSAAGAWVHAYLHRKEPDPGNAAYWYRRAGKPFFGGSHEAEWEAISKALLGQGG